MTGTTSRREGFALPVALLAMMVIGAIVTGGFYAASQGGSISVSTDLGSQAFYIAEYGLNEALGTWRNQDLEEIVDSVSVTEPEDTVRDSGKALGTYVITVRRIGAGMFLVSSRGGVTAGQRTAVRRVGAIVRTTGPSMPAITSLALYGGLTVGGNARIKGSDAGGPDCVAGDTVPGVTAYDSSLVGASDSITGEPPVTEDTALTQDGLSDFGDLDLDSLRAMADIVFDSTETSVTGLGPETTTDAEGNQICDRSDSTNWGEPTDATHVCRDYFPIIHAQGDFQMTTGTGQGILIVDGDMHASGNFDFYGVIIVVGELKTTGTGNHFEGSVVVQGHGLLGSESTTLGNSLVQYSQCRVQDAFDATLRPHLLSTRSWIDFTAATRGATTVTD